MGKGVVHFADKADREIGTAKCGVRLNGTNCTEDKGAVTCERCGVSDVKAKREMTAVIGAGRADVEELRARAKRNGEAAYEASVANEQLEKRLHEVMAGMERATQTGLDACHEVEALRGKVKDLERDLAAAQDDAERVAQSHACLAVELKRWKQAAADLAGAGQSLLSCALVR